MKYHKLGTSDLNVSQICLGTMTWGQQNTIGQAHGQLDYAVAQGINFIDTAEMYLVPPRAQMQGRTEAHMGAWLKRQQRDKLLVATKIGGPRPGLDYIRGDLVWRARSSHKRWTRASDVCRRITSISTKSLP